ncbi:hypothetical protein JZ751_017795 [Albula glossodonta]|uniref:Uncharacterized protein n=1 Tax=Albula glossodonta TaxID=121402 RepID=A0A8T2PPE5_9TELE|nr:hypothetical protein JZ751_017795 [Albula glossodonta]
MLEDRDIRRYATVPAFSELAMPDKKMPRNHSREYWYMGSTLERSETQKKRICVRTATGTYSSRVASMSFSVSSATITLACDGQKNPDEFLVINRVPLDGAQSEEDLVFDLLQLLLHASIAHDQLVFCLFQIWPFFCNHPAQELILQATTIRYTDKGGEDGKQVQVAFGRDVVVPRELSQGLAPAATHPQQQGVAEGLTQDAADPTHMLDGVHEEHQPHLGGADLIVVLHPNSSIRACSSWSNHCRSSTLTSLSWKIRQLSWYHNCSSFSLSCKMAKL